MTLQPLLDQVAVTLRRYVVLNQDQTVALTLWVAHTHAFSAADVTPYIGVSSPTKRAGKSRLFEALELLVREPMRVSNITSASLFRSIADRVPTLLLDEVDAQGFPRDLRAVLNSGYRQGATVPRTESQGGVRVVVRYPTFCPKAFAGIGSPLPHTVTDRSIPIRLQRRAPDEHIEPFIRRDVQYDFDRLHSALLGWADEHVEELASTRPTIPGELHDRSAEIWGPLFAIADLAGRAWPVLARVAAVNLNGDEDEPDPGVQILRDVTAVLDEQQASRIASAELLSRLQDLEAPAHTSGYSTMTLQDLARALRPFDITPRVLRIGRSTARGYEAADFDDARRRYLPNAVTGVTGVTPVTGDPVSAPSAATPTARPGRDTDNSRRPR